MPLSPRPSSHSLARPSSLPLPALARQVVELVPPPAVPRDLATPSPVRPRQSASKILADTRGGSLSPAVHSDKIIINRTENEKNSKFVKLLDHNIHNSNILFKQSGTVINSNTSLILMLEKFSNYNSSNFNEGFPSC